MKCLFITTPGVSFQCYTACLLQHNSLVRCSKSKRLHLKVMICTTLFFLFLHNCNATNTKFSPFHTNIETKVPTVNEPSNIIFGMVYYKLEKKFDEVAVNC